MPGRLRYATDILSAGNFDRRVARTRQSAAAAALLERLCEPGFHPTATSKSHSRALVSAAAGDAPELLLGIDVELIAPDRPFAMIARAFLASVRDDLAAADFYRGWTFFEAYFKALQKFPNEAEILAAAAHCQENAVLRFDNGICAIQHTVADAFQLCLVWKCAAPDIAVERVCV